MVRVNLVGVHSVRQTLASGKTVTYHYAWRSGPGIDVEPGSPQFLETHIQEAHKNTPERKPRTIQTLSDLVDRYSKSVEFDALSADTRRGYEACLRAIKERFGTMPVRALSVKRVRGHFTDRRDEMKEHPRSGDIHISVLNALLSWAEDRGYVEENRAIGIGRLSKANPRAEIVWEHPHLALIPAMRAHIMPIYLFALAAGQRQGDILALHRQMPGKQFIHLTQQKTGAKVSIYRTPTINVILDMAGEHDAVTHFATTQGRPWTSTGFRVSARKYCARVGIEGVTFHDLRGTFENRVWESGCTEAECYAVTGRALKSAQSANAYFARSERLSRRAMEKTEQTFWEQGCKGPCKTLESLTGVSVLSA